MRTWTELNKDEQDQALQIATDRILKDVVEGSIRFNDELNEDTLQAEIDQAIGKANRMQTPWFAGEYVFEAVGDMLEGMAQCDAEDALYPSPEEDIIRLGKQ